MRFTVHCPACRPEGSPRCHRPPGGDVACGVDVGMAPEPAGAAPERRLALAVVRCVMPAVRAGLRRVRCVDLFHPTIRLMLQADNELTPGAGEDAPVQPRLRPHIPTRLFHGSFRGAGHSPDVEVFHPNDIEPAGQVGGGLFHPVLAPIHLAGRERSDRRFDPSAPVRPSLAADELALQPRKPPSLARCQTGCGEQFPGRQGSRDGHTTVNPNLLVISWRGKRIACSGKGDMPAARPIPRDPVGLHPVRHGAGPAEPHPPHFRHPYAPGSAVQLLNVPWTDGHLPESLVSTGLAPRRAAMCASEEVPHRLAEVPQRLLLYRLRPGPQPCELGAGSGQLPGLLDVSRCRRAPRPPVSVLFDGKVPHKPGMPTMLHQPGLVTRCRQQPITRHRDQPSWLHRQNRAPRTRSTRGRLPSQAKPEVSADRRFDELCQ